MNLQLRTLDLDSLNRLYESKVQELDSHMSSGKSWDDLKEIREHLSELSAIIYEKVQSPQDTARIAS